MDSIGEAMYALVVRLFPICRSLTGDGVRQTLRLLADPLPGLEILEVPSGTKAFDWVVPPEWNVRQAYVLDPGGRKIIDFAESNLHLVGYSIPVQKKVSLRELQAHLHSLPAQPEAIPYITSYYEERWGFCVSHRQREAITQEGDYTVVIDTDLQPGFLTYAELRIPGEREQEVFLSTYVCHPSMANNELSGPSVTTFLARWLLSEPRRYSYRIVFLPETIGSLTYLSLHLDDMKRKVIAGYNVTCVGDDRAFSYLPSRGGDTLADRAALHVLRHLHPGFLRYTYLDRGSDERQYCAPGVDLPVATVMRSKYGTYPEYHTSLDNLDLVTPTGLQGAYEALQKCIECIEADDRWQTTVLGEPQLGRRGLYPTLSTKETRAQVRDLMNLIAYCDGSRGLLEIAETIGAPMWELVPIAARLAEQGLLAVRRTESGSRS
jgi:aminopeptidase-like protein